MITYQLTSLEAKSFGCSNRGCCRIPAD